MVIIGGDDDKVVMMNRTTLPTPMPMLVVMLLVMIRHDASDDIHDGGELLRVWQTITAALVPQSLPFAWLLLVLHITAAAVLVTTMVTTWFALGGFDVIGDDE